MAVVILTTGLRGTSGIEKAVARTANQLAQVEDVSIITVTHVLYNGNVSTNDLNFKIDKRVKRYSLQELHVLSKREITDRNTIIKSIKHPFLHFDINQYDVDAMRYVHSKLTKDDTLIFAVPIAAEIYKLLNVKREYKTIFQVHCDMDDDIYNQEHLLNTVDCIDYLQPVSKAMKPRLAELTGIEHERIIPIYNFLKASDVVNEIEKKPSDKFRLSYPASVQERKNQLDAVKIVEQLSDDYVLQIYGSIISEYGQSVVKYVKDNKLDERVKFMGYASEEEIYENTDLLIQTSKSEGYSYTLVEAAYYKIPIVSYDCKYGANEMVFDNKTGYLIEMFDVDAAAQAVKKIKEDKNLYQLMSENVHQVYLDNFTPSKIVEQYKTLFTNSSNHTLNFEHELEEGGLVEILDKRVKKVTSLIKRNDSKQEIDLKLPTHLQGIAGTIKRSCYSYDFPLSVHVKDDVYTISYNYKADKPDFSTIVFEDNEGMQYYLFTINWSQNIEILRNLYHYNIKVNNDFVNVSGELENKYVFVNPKAKVIRDILDTNGEHIDFTVDFKLVDRVFYQVIAFNEEQNDFKIIYNDEQLDYHLPKVVIASYEDIWSSLIHLEQKYDLYNFKIDDVYIWEVIKPNLIIKLLVDNNVFTENHLKTVPQLEIDLPKLKTTTNSKLLINATSDVDLYKRLVNDEYDVLVVDNYSYVDLYKEFGERVQKMPILENDYVIKEKQKIDELVSIIDELQFTTSELVEEISRRIVKFKTDFNFYNTYFQNSKYSEIVIVSSAWCPGIVHAANTNNITSFELQYALATPKHLNYGLSKDRHYMTNYMYNWSEFWANKDVFSNKHLVLEGSQRIETLNKLQEIDCVFVSQHLLSKFSVKYISKLAENYPHKKFAYCLHPREFRYDSRLDQIDNIMVFKGLTQEAILCCDRVIGMFSTSIYDAAILNKDVYVLKVPGYEIVENEDFFTYKDLDDYTLDFS